jgi:hypothetical protein
MSGYEDDAGEFCGTPFIPNETVWIRQYTPLNRGRLLMKKKGRFGIWRKKYRYWAIQWFGAISG